MKLKDICTIQSGGTPARSKKEYWINGNIPWVKISDFTGKHLGTTEEYITEMGLTCSSAKIFRKGTLLYTIFATLGEVCILDIDAATNQAIAGITINDDSVDLEYLYYFLVSLKDHVNRIGRGVAQNNINMSILRDIEVPLPEYIRQKKIADNLRAVDRMIQLRQQQIDMIEQLVKSRFIELFGDLKTNPMGWPIALFTEFAEIDGTMTTDYEKYADYPHIGIDSIEKGTGELKGYRTVREDGVISGKYIFTPQHIIYSKIRPNLNKVALPTFEGLCSADAYPILPNKNNCNRVFLAVAMRSNYFLDYILQFSSRTNLPKVNRKELAGFRMPLPPLELQNQFAVFVEQVDKSKYYSSLSYSSCQMAANTYRQEWMTCQTLIS
jgi:type I restriction enzyme S subunit